MIIPNGVVEGLTTDGEILFIIPPAFRDAVRTVVEKCKRKHNGFCKISIDTPFKPRSTGPGSQSAHLHGHLQQLAREYGTLSLEEMKTLMKWDCVEWPRKRIKLGGGRIAEIPISESDADMVAESKAIEWCHHQAAELGIVLREE